MTEQQFKQNSFCYKGNRNYQGNSGKNFIRKNDRIRAREVRVIDENGNQLGVMLTQDALRIAKNRELDLVEISPNAQPPVCKILSFGKYKYEESKRQKGIVKPPSAKVKEVKLRAMIDVNDYATKLRRALEFLGEGNRLKLTLQFRGNELSNTSFGFNVVKRFVNDVSECGAPDCEPKLVGRSISLIITPCSGAKKPQKDKSSESGETKILSTADLIKL